MYTKCKTSAEAPKHKRSLFERLTRISHIKIVVATLFFFVMFGGQKGFGQGVGISEGPIVPEASSILELKYTSGSYKGFLVPRMSTANRESIIPAAQGLLVYDTVFNSFWYYDNGWISIAASDLGSPNQVLGMNNAGTANEYKTLEGTQYQIIIEDSVGIVKFSTPQDIHDGATPTFVSVKLSDLEANSGVYTDSDSTLTSVPPSSGTIGYWDRDDMEDVLSPSNLGDSITTTGGLNADGTVNLASTGVLTTVEGTLDVDEAANFDGNLDANAGVDITNADLTVGGANFTVDDATGDVATIGDVDVDGSVTSSGAVTGTSIIRSGGLATQFLKADGSVDASTYITSAGTVTNFSGNLAGDVTGPQGTTVVNSINGTTISSAGGALTTGTILRVTGVSTVDYGALDLSNTDAVTDILPVANGGTGQSAAITEGGILFGTSTTAMDVTAAGTSGQVLTSNGASDPTWEDPTGSPFANPSATSGLNPTNGSANTATLDFPFTSSRSTSDLTITVTGAAVGDAVSLGVPNSAVMPNSNYSAWVSAADIVKVRFSNWINAFQNPASETFRISVLKY